MFALSYEQGQQLPDLKGLVYCKKCRHKHLVRRSKGQQQNGEIYDGSLSFIKCQGKFQVVGVKGKDIRRLLRAKTH